MATIHALPTPPATAVEASECDVQIRAAVKAYNSSFGELAYWGWKLKRINGYEDIGYPHEFAYFASLNISKSWYYHAVAIGQACSHLSLEQLCAIPANIAELMLAIKPEIRTSFDWAREAATLSFRQFAALVQDRNCAVPGEPRVPMTVLSVRVPATAKDAILNSLSEFKDKHQLASTGQALEFVVADKFDRPNILGRLEEALKLMAGVSRALAKQAALREENQWLALAYERVEEAYKDLVAINREDVNEVHAQEIYAAEDATGDAPD